MSPRHLAVFVAALATCALAQPVFASCRIHNETGYSFTVESGNTSNQSVGSHTTTSIQSGRVIGQSKDGKSFSGTCRDGEDVKVIEKQNVVIMVPGR